MWQIELQAAINMLQEGLYTNCAGFTPHLHMPVTSCPTSNACKLPLSAYSTHLHLPKHVRIIEEVVQPRGGVPKGDHEHLPTRLEHPA
jgi:hypothetical protein